MTVRFEAGSGERWRDFRDAVGMMDESEVAFWPITGPRTLRWLMKYILRNGGTPLSRHTKWMQEHKVEDTHPHAYIHEVLSELRRKRWQERRKRWKR